MANGILDIDTYMMNVDPVNRNRSVPVSKALGLDDSYYTQGELYNVTPEINRPNFLTRTANDITSFVNRFKPSIKKGVDKGVKFMAGSVTAPQLAYQGLGITNLPLLQALSVGGGILSSMIPETSPQMKTQINMLSDAGRLQDNKITSGPLAGKNLQSLFGTNDYDEMLKKEIQKVKDRLSKQKGVRKGLLQELQQETLRREQAKVAAAQTMQDSNRTNKTGGYQAGYSRDFMEGPSGGDISGQSGGLGGNQGGAGGTATMGSFAEGGLASLLID